MSFFVEGYRFRFSRQPFPISTPPHRNAEPPPPDRRHDAHLQRDPYSVACGELFTTLVLRTPSTLKVTAASSCPAVFWASSTSCSGVINGVVWDSNSTEGRSATSEAKSVRWRMHRSLGYSRPARLAAYFAAWYTPATPIAVPIRPNMMVATVSEDRMAGDMVEDPDGLIVGKMLYNWRDSL